MAEIDFFDLAIDMAAVAEAQHSIGHTFYALNIQIPQQSSEQPSWEEIDIFQLSDDLPACKLMFSEDQFYSSLTRPLLIGNQVFFIKNGFDIVDNSALRIWPRPATYNQLIFLMDKLFKIINEGRPSSISSFHLPWAIPAADEILFPELDAPPEKSNSPISNVSTNWDSRESQRVRDAMSLPARELLSEADEWSIDEVQQALTLELGGKRRALVIKHLTDLSGSSADAYSKQSVSRDDSDEENYEDFYEPPEAPPYGTFPQNPYERDNAKALRRASGIYVAQCKYCGKHTRLDAGVLARALGSRTVERQDRAKETMRRGANMSFSKRKQALTEQMRLTILAEQEAAQRGFHCQHCGGNLIG
jgi:hypothetical protein